LLIVKFRFIFQIEQKIAFENCLYGDSFTEEPLYIEDIAFMVDKIVKLPYFRPFSLDKCVKLSIKYGTYADFRKLLLKRSFERPVLVHRLFKVGVFGFNEIEPYLIEKKSHLLCYYFRRELKDFNQLLQSFGKPNCSHAPFFEKDNIDSLIEYGFEPMSIEYCLKYDSIEQFRGFRIGKQQYGCCSPFEWSCGPKRRDLLSIAGYFGSIKCFKHLLLNNFPVSGFVRSAVVCGGNLDMYHLISEGITEDLEIMSDAASHCRLSLLRFFHENGASFNTDSEYF